MAASSLLDSAPITADVEVRRPIAPLWHTGCVVLSILLAILSGHLVLLGSGAPYSYAARWLTTIRVTWLFLGAVIAGLYSRTGFLRSTLLAHSRSWANEAGTALLVFAACMLPNMLVGALIRRNVLHLVTLSHNPAVLALMTPHSFAQLALWLLTSITAGICEEAIFRGYLLQQFTALLNLPAAVALSSLLFGFAHLYQGGASVIAITLLGVINCLVVLQRGNLRAVILAHILLDSVAGIVLFHHQLA